MSEICILVVGIDCPPGDPRPDHYLPEALTGTHLKPEDGKLVSHWLGAWSWEFNVPGDGSKVLKKTVYDNLKRVYESTRVRGAEVKIEDAVPDKRDTSVNPVTGCPQMKPKPGPFLVAMESMKDFQVVFNNAVTGKAGVATIPEWEREGNGKCRVIYPVPEYVDPEEAARLFENRKPGETVCFSRKDGGKIVPDPDYIKEKMNRETSRSCETFRAISPEVEKKAGKRSKRLKRQAKKRQS